MLTTSAKSIVGLIDVRSISSTCSTGSFSTASSVTYTVDDAWTVASAVAVKGDTIMAIGSDDDMAAYIGPDTEVMDLIHKYVDENPGRLYYRVAGFNLRAWPNNAADNQRLNEEFPDPPSGAPTSPCTASSQTRPRSTLPASTRTPPVPNGGTAYHYEG
jgi:hypothetical protein